MRLNPSPINTISWLLMTDYAERGFFSYCILKGFDSSLDIVNIIEAGKRGNLLLII